MAPVGRLDEIDLSKTLSKKEEAKELHREAVRLAPNVFRLWTRMLRSYLPK